MIIILEFNWNREGCIDQYILCCISNWILTVHIVNWYFNFRDYHFQGEFYDSLIFMVYLTIFIFRD